MVTDRRRLLIAVAALVAGALLVPALSAGGLVLAVRFADGDLFARAQPAEPTPTLPGPVATGAAAVPNYRLPGDMCQEADFTRFRPTFTIIGDFDPRSEPAQTSLGVATCDGTTGNDSVHGAFHLRVAIFRDASTATDAFYSARDQTEEYAVTSTVAGVGRAAYSFVEPDQGPTVHAVDGNLTIRLNWTPADDRARLPDGLVPTLADVCESTMALLRV